MTILPLPQWLRDGAPAVAYFPRRDTALAEAWPVIDWKRTDTTVVVLTETGEIRFRLWDGGTNPTQMGTNPRHGAILIPASDPRAVAAEDRTKVMRAVNHLSKVIRDTRPAGAMSTETILWAVDEIAAAATVAHDDIAAVLAVRS